MPDCCCCGQVLSLLCVKGVAGAQAEATAGGLVAVVMNVLQQQAIAGVLVSEVGVLGVGLVGALSDVWGLHGCLLKGRQVLLRQ
jgi:hypothetical protein